MPSPAPNVFYLSEKPCELLFPCIRVIGTSAYPEDRQELGHDVEIAVEGVMAIFGTSG